jgi:CubicO group peptidase (beta-lactamase class C family)
VKLTNRLALAGGAALAFGLGACSSGLSPADPSDIGSWMELYEVPGANVAVIRDFALDYVEVHGVKSESTREPVTERTLTQAASISKSVSAVGVMTLVQDGTVSLDTDVNEYLTSWQVPYNDFQRTEKVTLRRLLSHTAGTTVHGFRGYRYPEPAPTLIQILNGEPPANSAPIVVDMVPGSEWRYSGGGYVIITQVVQDVTGSTFPDFIRERVLEPIGMEHSTYEQPLPDSLLGYAASGYYANGVAVPGGHHDYPEMAAAALWTTATDIARFVIELQLSLRGESNRVLTKENVELLLTEVMNDYALGFGLRRLHGQEFFWHAGANDGFRGGMLGHMSLGHGVVVQTNSDNGNDLTEAVIELIGKREHWPGF